MLTNGDKIFVPNYGAGIIKNIELKNIYNTVCEFVYIELVINEISLSIPINRIKNYKIREIVTKEQLYNCINIIKEEPKKIEKKWSKRYRNNNDKISTGILEKECEVLRDLYYLKSKGIMPLGEEKILNKAEELVGSEIMLVLDISLNEALKIIRNLK
ncbi:transcriptional regulator, CarD family [Clostridium sp. USBA 49]|uniref:CarD family transcriptional regulator n=1 Tax=Clostridium sp. USBA 49 TaxID=1881060 RepID=UPI000999F331|nr:CarD family transcriptional regulator [Clostridium sp. USBA 49]SKA77891.1 transcriptional regulator, CarD family [Clostridium sp. USBA 49]